MSIAIITGASSGMWKEFVNQLDKYYDIEEVIVIARRKELLEELSSITKAKVTPLPLDLTQEESFEKYKEFIEEKTKKEKCIKLLINGSGFGKFEEFDQGDYKIHNDMVDLNCKALQAITYLTLPYMEEGSDIVQIASMASIQPVPYIGLYGATKAFVLSFSRALNIELRHKKIKVTALLPFWVQTDFFKVASTTDLIKYFDLIYTKEFIVQKCYEKLIKKHHKDIIVPGKFARMQYRLVKLFPHSRVMRIWLRKQKIKY